MGQFSWLDCITEEQVVDNEKRDVYVLIPKEFGGGHIKETCYDGYGNFGEQDIYDLVADWNREILSKKPNYIFPHAVSRAKYVSDNYGWKSDYSERIILQIRDEPWFEFWADLSLSREEIVNKTRKKIGSDFWEYRLIGIDLACYDEDNEALPYPIKITHNPNAVYESCGISLSDPNQGWEQEEDYDWDDYDDEDDGWC